MKQHLEEIVETFKNTKNRFVNLPNINIKIVFIPMYISTMNCKPTLRSFLFPSKREYVISVNSNENFSQYTIPISVVDKSVLIGWFGHELSHIIQYEWMSFHELIKFPFKYFLNPSFRKSFEVECTEIAREAGFVSEINEVEKFLRNDKRVNKKYKERFEKFYVSE